MATERSAPSREPQAPRSTGRPSTWSTSFNATGPSSGRSHRTATRSHHVSRNAQIFARGT
eukprot:4975002-Pyramimonas_sp.AAC.1